MLILRPVAGLLALGLAAAVSAAELSVVPADLARYLAGGGRMTPELPADFPALTLPEGLSVMGAFDQGRRQLVLLRSLTSGIEAQQAIVADLVARGWIDMTDTRDRAYGFIVPAVNPVPASLCHDELGNLQVRGEDGVENRVYLTRTGDARGPDELSCEEMLAARLAGRPPFPRRELDSNPFRFLPTLASPSLEPDPGQVPLNQPDLGIRGVPFDVLGSSIARVRLGTATGMSHESELLAYAPDYSPAELDEHYAAQLREQGWTRDSGWGGEDQAISNWVREPEEGLRVLLSLRILPREADRLAVQIRLMESADP